MTLYLDNVEYGYGLRKIGALSGSLFISTNASSPPITLICGQNGSGKSTFLKTIAGLLPLLGGRILWNQEPLEEAYPSGKICYLGDRLDFADELTIGSILDLLGGSSRENQRLIDLFMLHRRHPWKRLSTGQRQKTRLCVTLRRMERAELILLDEPFSGLDLDSQAVAMDVLKKLVQMGRKRLLICLHQEHFPKGWIQNRLLFANQSFSLKESEAE